MQMGKRALLVAVVGFAGEEDPLPPLSERLAVIGLASRVSPRGFTVGDAQVERPVDQCTSVLIPPKGPEDPFAAETDDGDDLPGSSEDASRDGHVDSIARACPMVRWC